MAEAWRLLRSPPLPAALNMALDQVLLEAVAAGASAPVLRLYRWSPSAVTIGYAQAPTDINIELSRRLGYDIVRRPTGGRAVLHESECTYAVVACAGPLFPASVSGSYGVIAGVLARALRSLGLPVEPVAERRAGRGPAICFIAPGQGELLCNGCKVAGSAQKRHGRAFLQHGSIPVDLDLQRLAQILGPGSGASADAIQLGRSIGWLNRFLSVPVSIADVEDALIASFVATLPVRFLPDEPTAGEWKAARHLAAAKYATEFL